MKINLLDLPVFYINLDSHPEKKESTESTLRNLGFTNINRFPGILDNRKAMGCARSHNELLKSLEAIETPYIIFEDDILVEKFISEIEVPDDADAVYLGISSIGLVHGQGRKRSLAAEKYDKNYYKIYNMLAAHAILYLNKDYSRFLIRASQTMINFGTNQDKGRADTMRYWNIYALNIPMFYQSGRYESQTKIALNRFVTKTGLDDFYS